jgi:hypothetical protein
MAHCDRLMCSGGALEAARFTVFQHLIDASSAWFERRAQQRRNVFPIDACALWRKPAGMRSQSDIYIAS